MQIDYKKLATNLLEIPTGSEKWEMDNRFVLLNKRPLKDFPQIYLSEPELALILEKYDQGSIPHKLKNAIEQANNMLDTYKLQGKRTDIVQVGHWLNSWLYKQALEEANSELRLAKVKEKNERPR